MKPAVDGTLLQACGFLPALQSRDTPFIQQMRWIGAQHR